MLSAVFVPGNDPSNGPWSEAVLSASQEIEGTVLERPHWKTDDSGSDDAQLIEKLHELARDKSTLPDVVLAKSLGSVTLANSRIRPKSAIHISTFLPRAISHMKGIDTSLAVMRSYPAYWLHGGGDEYVPPNDVVRFLNIFGLNNPSFPERNFSELDIGGHDDIDPELLARHIDRFAKRLRFKK